MISNTTTCKFWLRNSLRVLAVGWVIAGCQRDTTLAPGEVVPISVLRVKTELHRDLVENSVAVTSVSQPGIVFGLNDSGHQPRVFAFDSTGRQRGMWALQGARNRDWEAAALGPCGPMTARLSCLFIGDVGDNDARRPYVTLYRVPEPTAESNGESQLPLEVENLLQVRYPDQPHDVEAMYVAGDGSVFLITKRRLLDAQKRPRPSLIFYVPASAWDSSGTVTATLVDSLPIVPGSAEGRQVNDASLSPDGRRLAVRTYREVFVFAVDSVTGLPARGVAPESCVIAQLKQKQGEGIGWWWDGRRLLLTSEGNNAPLYVIECAL